MKRRDDSQDALLIAAAALTAAYLLLTTRPGGPLAGKGARGGSPTIEVRGALCKLGARAAVSCALLQVPKAPEGGGTLWVRVRGARHMDVEAVLRKVTEAGWTPTIVED